ncbi:hypothetical protein [Actinomadura harenae]|uniref:Leucine rich repeat variant n=1 Tax=Actinomadura harenae TaxID=2483351 RepID=A0A3M2M8Z0_9ACTN|nr:hypothetical protein [Actinomadura harenae]RMI45931.1 hypothetical protein EBO15_08440 [Actinomadura harenae]
MHPVLLGLAANPALPPSLLDRLIATGDRDIAAELAERDDLTPEQAAALLAIDASCAWPLAARHSLDVDPAASPDAALAFLSAGRGHPAWARTLLASPDPALRTRLVECPNLPPDVQDALACDDVLDVVAESALWAPSTIAARLARHPHADVRAAVAANESTPPDVLAALLTGDVPPPARCVVCERRPIPFVHAPDCPHTDCDLPPGAACDGTHQSTVGIMRQRALENPSTPASAAMPFADHPSLGFRWALASRPDLTPAAAARLAESTEPGVLGDLASNPAITEDLMRTLAASTDPHIRRAVARNPRVPLDLLVAVASNTRLGTAVRGRIATRHDPPNTLHALLADTPDHLTARAIAPHPTLTETRLRTLLDQHGKKIAAHVAANPNASSELLEALAALNPSQDALIGIARHTNATPTALLPCLTNPKAKRHAAAHPALPPQTVLALLADEDPHVAEAAAANPALPTNEMQPFIDRHRVQ